MSWNYIMGLVSVIALFLPIFFILVLRLGTYKTFPILLCYYAITFGYNVLTQGYIKSDIELRNYWNVCGNLLDPPMIILFLTYFSTSALFTRRMQLVVLLFLIFESVVVFLVGFNTRAVTIILAPGLAIVLGLSTHFFIRQTKITIMHQKAPGKAIIAAALLFAYGCYSIIYLMYYVFKTNYIEDTFLVYFLVVTFSSLLMTTGIIIERKRIQKLNELIQTRKELSLLYKDSKSNGGLRTAMLDFDKDNWK
jgi:hypothetical protein